CTTSFTLSPDTDGYLLHPQSPQTDSEKITDPQRIRPVDLLGEEHPARGEHTCEPGDVLALVTIHHEIERAIVERHLRMVVAVVSDHVDLVVLQRRGGQGNVRLPSLGGSDRRPRLPGGSGPGEAAVEVAMTLADDGAPL